MKVEEIFTDFTFRKWSGKGKTLAFAECTVAGIMKLDLFIMDGRNGHWVSLPSRQEKDDKGQVSWRRQARIPDKDTEQAFQQHVLAEYNKFTSASQTPADEDEVPF